MKPMPFNPFPAEARAYFDRLHESQERIRRRVEPPWCGRMREHFDKSERTFAKVAKLLSLSPISTQTEESK